MSAGRSKIQMVDLRSQYLKIKDEIDQAIQEVIDSCAFINGPAVKIFQQSLELYLGVDHVIPCANGTDALQIALMALVLKPGDEVIVPAFTYVATAEVIALLQLKPVMVDVDPDSFNIDVEQFEQAITQNTKAVVPVHLYGQSANMEAIMRVANQHEIYVVEDNAQALGADFIFSDGARKKTGTIGHIGTTSFFPSKNLGAYGDGGAIYTNDAELAQRIRMIANHGQSEKYIHDMVGCNSRLDSIQAAILNVKLKYLDQYIQSKQQLVAIYDQELADIPGIVVPCKINYSTHSYHQYTLKVKECKRDDLMNYLEESDIPYRVYYPIPLNRQMAYKDFSGKYSVPISEKLSQEVISIPIHPEMDVQDVRYISNIIKSFFAIFAPLRDTDLTD